MDRNLKLLDHYLDRDKLSKDVLILTDEKDSFSVYYYNRLGQPVIMGVDTCKFTFWRNRATKT